MATKRSTRRRTSLAPRKVKRGLGAAEIALAPDAPEVAQLSAEVRAAGGAPIGAYREPLSGRPILLATLPIAAVAPTPFQRDLSPTHTKRLAQMASPSASRIVRTVWGSGWGMDYWLRTSRIAAMT